MRLFAAVRPPADVVDHLTAALGAVGLDPWLAGTAGPVRWTAPQGWHLTVAFYGEVPDALLSELDGGLSRLATELDPFTLRLRGAGAFSRRTLWIGASGALDQMARLTTAAVALGEEVTGHGDGRERSRPHLTVARVVGPRRPSPARTRPAGRRPPQDDPLAPIVRALAVYEGSTWPVTEVLLIESRPGAGPGGGPLYRDRGAYRFAPADRGTLPDGRP